MNLSAFIRSFMKSAPKVDKKSKVDMALAMFKKRKK